MRPRSDLAVAGAAPARSPRIQSLDVFRGLTIAGMVIVNSSIARGIAYPPLVHSAWDGATFADMIFPAFLCISGASLVASVRARLARGASRIDLLNHVVRRTALLFASGVALSVLSFPERAFPFFAIRLHPLFSGVLQKTALAYALAAGIFVGLGARGAAIGALLFAIGHGALLTGVGGVGCEAALLTPECNVADRLNRALMFGLIRTDGYDVDGIGTVLPAAASVLAGVLLGVQLERRGRAVGRVASLVATGAWLVVAGILLAQWIPINKPLWTPSYVALTAGLSAIALAALHWVVDIRRLRRWGRPFEILGHNALAVFLASGYANNCLRVHVLGVSLPDLLQRAASPHVASLAYALLVLATLFAFALVLARRGWYLKF